MIILFCLSAVLISAYLLIRYKYKYSLSIRATTILMQSPFTSANSKRLPLTSNKLHEDLISKESALRKLAYKNTSIKIGEAFFDDSDMESEYYLVVVYDKKSKIALLSARYHFNKSIITKVLQGDGDAEKSTHEHNLNLERFKEHEIFLADRLSGNTHSALYRRYRDYIYLLLYSEILNHNKNCKYILMARKEKHEKLLTKYLRLGANIAGSTTHKGKEHWILIGNLRKDYARAKLSILSNLLVVFKFALHRLKPKK
jgi:hypothetical protein